MRDDAKGFVSGLRRYFASLPDPRVEGRCKHLLLDIIAIALLAVMSGAEDWPDLEEYGKRRRKWLGSFLELPNGIASHDTFRRVFGILDRKQFAACLFSWTQALHEATGGKLIAIDGKSVRRSIRKKAGLRCLHLVTAWSSVNGLTLGQEACAEKSNEITAIPELLSMLNVQGCTVTLDAMGCQKNIARQIRGQKGHYVLALKGNQSGLEEDMRTLYEEAADKDFSDIAEKSYETDEKGHGREEYRRYSVIEIPQDHRQRRLWKDLRTLTVVTRRRLVGDKETWEVSSYVSSLGPKAKKLATAIRKHWSIENTQHWSLDVIFGEDVRRQQDRNGVANLAAVRRLALSLLRQEKTNKRGVKNKRLACALDTDYLLQVLANAKF